MPTPAGSFTIFSVYAGLRAFGLIFLTFKMVYINENIMFTLQITLQIFFKMGAVNLKIEYYVNQQNDIILGYFTNLLYK